MAFWKKVVDLFVETEEEEEELKPEEISLKMEPVVFKEETKEVIPQEKKEEEVTEKKSIFITEKPLEEKKAVEKKKVTQETEGKNDAYEFSPIISPMFGVTSKQEEKPRKEVKRSPIHNSSRLGTVISPIYGINSSDYQPYNRSLYDVSEDEEAVSLEDIVSVKNTENSDVEIPFVKKNTEEIKKERITTEKHLSVKEDQQEIKNEQFEPENFDYFTEETVETKTEEVQETEVKNEEISRILKEYSEEDVFEREKQPTLFDL